MKHNTLIYRLLLLLIFSVSFTSCSGGGSETSISTNNNPTSTTFQGAYSGQFTGAQTGTWNIVIDTQGGITGSANTSSLPLTNFTLSGRVDEDNPIILISATNENELTFIVEIIAGVVTGSWEDNSSGGILNGELLRADDGISGALSIGIEINNYTFFPLNVFNLNSFISFNNDVNPVNPPYYDSHAILVFINSEDNTLAAISYSYFNTNAENSQLTGDYLYLLNCASNLCTSIDLNLENQTITFTNTDLPVDNSPETNNREGVTNLATLPATINGSISW